MRRLPFIVLCSIAFRLLNSSSLWAEDWPQWRGPERNDVSDETNLLETWPAEGPPQVWLTRNCGVGYSGPAVVGDRLYIMGARDDAELLICIDVTDGSEIWAAEIGEALNNDWGNGPRGTPTVDGNRVYGLGGQGNLICVNASDGNEVWRVTMQDLGGSIPNWGYTESVLIDGQQLICTPGGDQGALVALDKQTGAKIWQSADFKDPAQYASTIVAEPNGIRQYIQLTEQSVVGIHAENGNVVWRVDWPGRVAVIPTPIYHDGYVYATAGYGAGCNLLKIGEDNQATSVYEDAAQTDEEPPWRCGFGGWLHLRSLGFIRLDLPGMADRRAEMA